MNLTKFLKHSLSTSKQTLPNFTLIDTQTSLDLNLQISRHLHSKSGAMIYHLHSNNPDNAFATIVRTLPKNAKGCSHILQHLSCCGTQKYPIRDPFFSMTRRSVNTYMNAWTGQDFTCYPFSSPNFKDFQNIYKIYLDITLKPLLNQLDFRQQGWRYEYNPQTTIKQLKGIVLNQMKGAYQDPDRQLYDSVITNLYENTPYSFDSGGKPQHIVKLSYQQIINMHQYSYHPSNMSFYYYGNSDITDKLQYLQNQYLLKYNYKNNINQYLLKNEQLNSKMPSQISKIFHTTFSHSIQAPNIALTYNLGWLTNFDQIDLLCLNIISYLLLQTNLALFYQQFIQKELVDSFGGSGLVKGSIISFVFILKNSRISGQQTLKRTQQCFHSIINNGIDTKRLDQYMIQTQLDILTPKKIQGIQYLERYNPYMLNRMSLQPLINIRKNLSTAISKLKDPEQLKLLITKYFLSNPRKVVIKQQPSKKQINDYTHIKGLDIDQNIIKNQQKQLKQRQQSNALNSLQCLPKLFLTDLITPKQHTYIIKKQGLITKNTKARQLHIQIQKKQINFIKLIFRIDMSNPTNRQLLKFLDIWRYTIKQGISVQGMSNKQVISKLNLCSTSFDIQFVASSPLTDPTSLNILISASCLDSTLDQFINLLYKILHTPIYSTQYLSNIFRSYKSDKMEELINQDAMIFCIDYCSSFTTKQGEIFNSYFWVTEGLKIAQNPQPPNEFTALHDLLKNGCDVTLVQHSNQFKQNILQKLGFKYSQDQHHSPTTNNSHQPLNTSPLPQISIAVTNTYDVNFCTQQYPGPQYLSKQHAHIQLFLKILQQDYLHPKIRQKGGAYGSDAKYLEFGSILLLSYMDQYSTQTYQKFDQSIKQILHLQLQPSKLQQAKITIIGRINRPILPYLFCMNQILKGTTTQQLNQFRNIIKQSTWKQIQQTGSKYLVNTNKNRVMFGKNVPKYFHQEPLKIPKSINTTENQYTGPIQTIIN